MAGKALASSICCVILSDLGPSQNLYFLSGRNSFPRICHLLGDGCLPGRFCMFRVHSHWALTSVVCDWQNDTSLIGPPQTCQLNPSQLGPPCTCDIKPDPIPFLTQYFHLKNGSSLPPHLLETQSPSREFRLFLPLCPCLTQFSLPGSRFRLCDSGTTRQLCEWPGLLWQPGGQPASGGQWEGVPLGEDPHWGQPAWVRGSGWNWCWWRWRAG